MSEGDTMKCPFCGGEGTVEAVADGEDGTTCAMLADCPDCNGFGRVPVGSAR